MKLNNRKSYYTERYHSHDDFKNLGYQYWKSGVLRHVLSHEMFSNPVQDKNYTQIDKLFIYLVNAVKQIKTQYSIAHDKDTILIN
jgi:hypothetical protein